MRTATDLMVHYAQFHRDRRNIATHCVGVPLLVFAVGVLLARPVVGIGAFNATPAWAAWSAASLWYLSRGNLVLGAVVSLGIAVLVALSQPLGDLGIVAWLTAGVGLLVLGAAIMVLGHYYEGRRRDHVGDLRSLLVGPMFVAAEALFALGWGKALLAEIERRAGPTHLRDLHHSAA